MQMLHRMHQKPNKTMENQSNTVITYHDPSYRFPQIDYYRKVDPPQKNIFLKKWGGIYY